MIGGHHLGMFVAISPKADPTPHPCTDDDMANIRFIAAGGGGLDTIMPTGVALRIAKGQQIILQSHYHNTSDEPRRACVALSVTRSSTQCRVFRTRCSSW